MSNGYRPMQKILVKDSSLCVCLIFLLQLKSTVASQKRDYLTEEEIEQLREAQEPPLRMNVFTGILNKRFEKVRSSNPEQNGCKKRSKGG